MRDTKFTNMKENLVSDDDTDYDDGTTYTDEDDEDGEL